MSADLKPFIDELWVACQDTRPIRATRLDGADTAPTELYFVRAECPTGFIKVGIASNIQSRLSNLQAGCPYKVTLIKTIPNAARMEKPILKRFAAHKSFGEWMHPHRDLLDLIDAL